MVFGESPLEEKLTALAEVLAICDHEPLPRRRSMRKPVSLVEASIQVRSMRVLEAAAATRSAGAAGRTRGALGIAET